MSSPVVDLLRAFANACEKLGVRWYLFGAQAALLHGSPRLTADVDVTVELGSRSSSELVTALQDASFALRIADANDFVERTRVLPLVHLPSGIPLDVVIAGPGIEELFLARAVFVNLEAELSVPVARAEDLIAMKILAGRPKDIEDVTAILAAQAESIDVVLVRETLEILERALNQSDLIPAFERIRQRYRS